MKQLELPQSYRGPEVEHCRFFAQLPPSIHRDSSQNTVKSSIFQCPRATSPLLLVIQPADPTELFTRMSLA